MVLHIAEDAEALGAEAAKLGAEVIRQAIEQRGRARIILATGNSQLTTLAALLRQQGIDWRKVEAFHLDEYVGMDDQHPASFRRYLRQRFVEPTGGMAAFYPVNGDAQDLEAESQRLERLLQQAPVDLAFVGIGENGHLAFNDPPADFQTTKAYLLVSLDEACRRQQMGEGWFANLDQVPQQAMSMSIRQILSSRVIVCSVPDARKAGAVAACLHQEVSPLRPASILRQHPCVHLLLDLQSASQLQPTALKLSALVDSAR